MFKKAATCLLIANLIGGSILGVGCNNNQANTQNKTTAEEEFKNHKIGDIVDMDEYGEATVQVLGMREVEPNVYAIEMEIVNNTDYDVSVVPGFSVVLKDNDNVKAETYITVENPIRGQIVGDIIRPNDILKGEAVFKVDEGYYPSTLEIDLDLGYYTIYDLK